MKYGIYLPQQISLQSPTGALRHDKNPPADSVSGSAAFVQTENCSAAADGI